MPRLRSLFLLCVALSLAAVATAHAAPGSGWYKIELIAFERLGDRSLAGEFWPADPGHPDWADAVTLQPAGSGGETAFEQLSPKDYTLGPQSWSLSRERSGVRPLIHRAWVQPIPSGHAARPVYLRSSGSVDVDEGAAGSAAPGSTGARMEGIITLIRNHYVHARFDLLLRRPGTATDPQGMRIFRLQASRRLRSGELHYIDHPAMGILIKITRVGPAQGEQAPDSGADQPSGT
jgi:hypothetical protein